MKLKSRLTINDRNYPKGSEVPWYHIYPFFMVHMLMFGGSGFLMAYSSNAAPVSFLYLHGGFAIVIYTVFYLVIFGRDEVKWMFINAALGFFGIFSQIGWLLSLFGKKVEDYPFYLHVIPFLYFVLYTFLLRHAVIDFMGVREDDMKREKVEYLYIGLSVFFYSFLYFLEKL